MMAARPGPATGLVLCAGTVLQAPGLVGKVDVAGKAGFDVIGLWYEDYVAARADGLSDGDIQTVIADAGLTVGEVDVLAGWAPTIGPAVHSAADVASQLGHDERAVMQMAHTVGARSITAVELLGAPVDPDAVVEAFAGLCDRAAEFDLKVNLEFMPFSGIPDLAAGLRIVTAADRPNGGLMMDAWHLFRSGSSAAEVAALPAAIVNAVQLSDAPAIAPIDLRAETGSGRLLPGDGDTDLVGLVRALDAIGVDVPLGVEVFSSELRARGAAEAAALAMAALRRVVDESRAGTS